MDHINILLGYLKIVPTKELKSSKNLIQKHKHIYLKDKPAPNSMTSKD